MVNSKFNDLVSVGRRSFSASESGDPSPRILVWRNHIPAVGYSNARDGTLVTLCDAVSGLDLAVCFKGSGTPDFSNPFYGIPMVRADNPSEGFTRALRTLGRDAGRLNTDDQRFFLWTPEDVSPVFYEFADGQFTSFHYGVTCTEKLKKFFGVIDSAGEGIRKYSR